MRQIICVILAILLLLSPGCYTLLGAITGPITGPLDWDQYLSTNEHYYLSKVIFIIHVPMIALGTIFGIYKGVICDLYLLQHAQLPDIDDPFYNIWRPFTTTFGFHDGPY